MRARTASRRRVHVIAAKGAMGNAQNHCRPNGVTVGAVAEFALLRHPG